MNTKQKIISGIIRGDEQILKGFYRDNIRYVQRYILQNSGSEEDAEDIFQDALVFLYQKLSSNSLEIKFSLGPYFFGICRNMWLTRLRKKKQLSAYGTSLLQETPIEYSIQDDIENNERAHVFRKHFQKLSHHNKNLLTLFFEGKSSKQVAQETGYTEGYTRKKKFEAKKQLLAMIEKDPSYLELRMMV